MSCQKVKPCRAPAAGQAIARRPIIKKYSEHIYIGFGWHAELTSSIIAEYTATKIKDKKFPASAFLHQRQPAAMQPWRERSGARPGGSLLVLNRPRLAPLLSGEKSPVQTSTKIVEEPSQKNLPQTKGRRCQDRWRCRQLAVGCQFGDRTDGSAKRLWVFDRVMGRRCVGWRTNNT